MGGGTVNDGAEGCFETGNPFIGIKCCDGKEEEEKLGGRGGGISCGWGLVDGLTIPLTPGLT
jgi:hypothetical protein